jgi:hypothetical protein
MLFLGENVSFASLIEWRLMAGFARNAGGVERLLLGDCVEKHLSSSEGMRQ